MGFYQIGADSLPWGVSCAIGRCEAKIEPTAKAYDLDDLFPVMYVAGWGFDAFAGANVPTCRQHASEHDRKNLKRIVERQAEQEVKTGVGNA